MKDKGYKGLVSKSSVHYIICTMDLEMVLATWQSSWLSTYAWLKVYFCCSVIVQKLILLWSVCLYFFTVFDCSLILNSRLVSSILFFYIKKVHQKLWKMLFFTKKVIFILKIFKFLYFLDQVILPGKLDKFFIEWKKKNKKVKIFLFEQDHYFPIEVTLQSWRLHWDC